MAEPKEEKAITELIASLIYKIAGIIYPTVCKFFTLFSLRSQGYYQGGFV